MSQAAFPYASDAWAFISKQPSANEIGPLGQRAGLDITELYPNVIRMYPFPDARSWVNVGIGADTDIFTQDSIKSASFLLFTAHLFFGPVSEAFLNLPAGGMHHVIALAACRPQVLMRTYPRLCSGMLPAATRRSNTI